MKYTVFEARMREMQEDIDNEIHCTECGDVCGDLRDYDAYDPPPWNPLCGDCKARLDNGEE